jgi:hypothetical protein
MEARMRKAKGIGILVGLTVLLILGGIGVALLTRGSSATERPEEPLGRTIATPATYKNLSVFLIKGPDHFKGRTYLTLEEALKRKQVEVKETGEVSQLAMDNVGTASVYIQSGEIVRGGKQDRALRYDMIVSPGARQVPLASFCVEQGRWAARGKEVVSKFSKSKNSLVTKQLRISNLIGNQAQVWSQVSAAQEGLSNNLGLRVNSAGSPTSLELSLEHDAVKKKVKRYTSQIKRKLGDDRHAVGLGFAVNGQLSAVHIYGSSALFKKLLPKLLKEAAVEALAELKKGKRFRAPNADKVWQFISEARQGRQITKRPSKRVTIYIAEADTSVATHTYDVVGRDVLHESYLSR